MFSVPVYLSTVVTVSASALRDLQHEQQVEDRVQEDRREADLWAERAEAPI